jgi:hypothetical protein
MAIIYVLPGGIAQLGERYNGIVEVSGSIPLTSTKTGKLTAKVVNQKQNRVPIV